MCGHAYPFRHAALGAGGLVCEACARSETGLVLISGAAVTAFERLRLARWEEALGAPLGRSEAELGALLDLQMSRLIGQPTRSAKFLRELKRLEPTAGGRA